MLKLEANGQTEQRILDYLNGNASEMLVEKINAGSKTLRGALDHAKEEARKLAGGASSICVDDATVFGWIIHFFEEDSIVEPKKKAAAKLPGAVKDAKHEKPSKTVKPEKAGPIVLELFSAEEMGVRP